MKVLRITKNPEAFQSGVKLSKDREAFGNWKSNETGCLTFIDFPIPIALLPNWIGIEFNYHSSLLTPKTN